jgi:surfeit locus 1 family protein
MPAGKGDIVANKRFVKPKPIALACTLLMLCVLLALGGWQVKRLAWKESLIAEIAAQQSAPTVDFAALQQPWDSHTHKNVFLDGRFLPLDDIAIGPRTSDGQVGYHLFTPFVLDDARIVFINRGWSKDRNAGTPVGKVKIKGVVRLPEKPDFAPDNNAQEDDWYWPDLLAMAKKRDIEVQTDVFVQLTESVDAASVPKPVAVTAASLPNNHLSYAIFWFGMAGVLLGVFFIYHYRAEKGEQPDADV